ncbi:MAG TPA: CDP-glycerol glycerophosphotransferase family protein [Actinopolymorphaceae bacterium]
MIDRVFPLLLLGISYAGLAVASGTGSIWGFALAGLVTAMSEVGLVRRWARVERTLAKLSFDVVVRSVVVDIFVIVLAVQAIGVTGAVRATVIGGVVLAAMSTGAYLLLRRLDADQPAVAWRNLTVARPRWWRSRYQGARLLGLAAAGPVLALLGDGVGLAGVVGTGLVIAAVVVAVAAPVWVVVALATHLDEQGSTGADDDFRTALLAAWTAFAPEVVIHFGGPDSSTHVVNVWTPSLAAIPHRCAVIVRERVHLDRVEAHGLPVVYLPGNTDVEMFATASVGVALYPTNIVKNNHLLRIPGIVDVFVGHGDSDKAGSASPITRIYDEVWVAGAAGRDRYRRARVGVRDDQIREIGRPQLADISRGSTTPTTVAPAGHAATDGLFTVLYAPTWEGFYAAWSYSSVVPMGAAMISALLAIPGVRVVYKPHPATGSQDPAYARADARLREQVRAAGGPHEVLTGVAGLYSAFNSADLLISDVSSVVTDFLYSRKPYVVTNPHELDDEAFRAEYPSAAAAALVSPATIDRLAGIVDDARGADLLRAQRDVVATYLLGAERADPLAGFAEAVAAALATQAARTQAARTRART